MKRREPVSPPGGLSQVMGELMMETRGPGFTDISSRVAGWLEAEGAGDGMLTVYCTHTSASLVIQENADP
ncbi:MAG: YjbQ family protein, partial [Pseudomonadota bacterium]|nr:YjbQ family protein [Pseudomonadota bacterium]